MKLPRVHVRPEMIRWARERAGLQQEDLARRFPKLAEWEQEQSSPTLKQLEAFARATHAPVGYFFLPEPPVERVPIPDFRIQGGQRIQRPSPDLLETIYICQQRQEWYRDFSRLNREEPHTYIGSMTVQADVVDAAEAIRHHLRFDLEERRRLPTWTEALRRFIEQADAQGILVMISGVVGNNNNRKLNPSEFRGFALVDEWAPLVFINGADTKAAQMFTLAHEIAHLWIGQTALSNSDAQVPQMQNETENWCNRVAAEILAPMRVFAQEFRNERPLRDELDRLARRFKVSTLVILRRVHDFGALGRNEFWAAYEQELARLREFPRGSGGNFYLTQSARVGKRFARALVGSALEGQTLHRDALRLLAFSKVSTLRELAHSLGVA